MLKKIFKFLLTIVIFFVVIFALVFVIRLYNGNKYKDVTQDVPKYYSDVTNIDLYPKKLDNINVTQVDNDAFQGFHLNPKNKTHKGVIVCYGGSEGSPNFRSAQQLAEQGYETLAVFMFGMKNQPKTLSKIPLEQFEDVLNYINKNINDNKPITVYSGSKGAEYALNLASKYDAINNIILQSPSAYNFSGLDFQNPGSSWTWKNKEFPYIALNNVSFTTVFPNVILPNIISTPISFKPMYVQAIANDKNRDDKLIPTSEIKANALLISGEDDQVWPSYDMSKTILKEKPNFMMYSSKNAGHVFYGNGIFRFQYGFMKTGGTKQANDEAAVESTKAIREFLNKYHR